MTTDTHTEQDAVLAILEKEYALEATRHAEGDLAWLPEFYLGRRKRIEAAREEVKRRCKEILDHCDAEERALEYRWGRDFRDEVNRQILQQGGKKKSIKTLYGSAGYRTGKPSLEIVDKEAAKRWAVAHLTDEQLVAAISGLNKTPLLNTIELQEDTNTETGEVTLRPKSLPAGCVYHEERQQFYPAPPSLEQLAASEERQRLAEGE